MFKHLAPLLIVLSLNAHAGDAEAPQVERTILTKHDRSGVPGKEVVVGIAIFPAGSVTAFHTHPVVIKGSVTVEIRGGTDVALKAGDGFFNPRGSVHSVVAGPEGATVVATWIVDKDALMTTPAL
jgi:quercetin dioxygenase-like cupin family protein